MTKPKPAELSFEDALAKLETIVDAMEGGDVPLAELLARFEEGTTLLKHCESRLQQAELKIEQLKHNKAGDPEFAAFQTTTDEA